MWFMDDVAKRPANRVQLTSDGHRAYLEAVKAPSDPMWDYAQLMKMHGPAPEGPTRRYGPAECNGTKKIPVTGNPEEKQVSTCAGSRG